MLHTMNGASILFRLKDAVYVRIPEDLQQLAGDGKCTCTACVHSGKPAMWDTLVVPTKHTAGEHCSTVHMPDPKRSKDYFESKGLLLNSPRS